MAGLWADDLHIGLQWYRSYWDKKADVSKKVEIYQAPSWSWASQNGKVSYMSGNRPPDSKFDTQYKCTAYNVRLLGQDPFGGIETASLTLVARLIADKVYRVQSGQDPRLQTLASLDVWTDVYLDSNAQGASLNSTPPNMASVFCMPLELPNHYEGSKFNVLLLQRTKLAKTYRRIGLAFLRPGSKCKPGLREYFMQSPLQTITLV
ncbi:hypothetical protein MBLNU457_g1042t1 [Dothideomycetes sp. NU457]